MTPERYQQIKQLFQAVLELDTGERRAFLDAACVSEPMLRSEVEKMLAAHEQANSFIEAPAFQSAARLLIVDESASLRGRHIGPYRVVREIGQGGMGAVYLAERADEQYQKQVAIKLVRRGLDTEDIIRRFLAERQILANLDHPNIARLLDGGMTEEGLPYFVMDYVEGLPLSEYCDERKLSITERLKLFRAVCSAVHYAHQNLVIHRDLKPGNILVAADGTPKLLDFGIAKVFHPESPARGVEATVTRLRAMTPEYASPEQVRGEQITTASDTYSLGVILYQLLTAESLYREALDRSEAECREAMRTYRKTPGSNYAMPLSRLGLIQKERGNYQEAETLLAEALDLFQRANGEAHSTTRGARQPLAHLTCLNGDCAKAKTNVERDLALLRQSQPEGHSSLAGPLVTLGMILIEMGHYARAEGCFLDAIRIMNRAQLKNPMSLAATKGALGECLMAQKRYAEAESLFKESYESLKACQVARSPRLKVALRRLVTLYEKWNKPELAAHFSAQS